jgi:hypothetical protein
MAIPTSAWSIVVARYGEDSAWLLSEAPRVFLYDKSGEPTDGSLFGAAERLPNVGRESHTYLRHILSHYDRLTAVLVFVQGHIDDHLPFLPGWRAPETALEAVRRMAHEAATSATGLSHATTVAWGVNGPHHAMRLRHWKGDTRQREGAQLPYGEWFERHVGRPLPSDHSQHLMFPCGVFAATRERIRSRPRAYYESLLAQLAHDNNPEEGHFMERSWYYVFG